MRAQTYVRNVQMKATSLLLVDDMNDARSLVPTLLSNVDKLLTSENDVMLGNGPLSFIGAVGASPPVVCALITSSTLTPLALDTRYRTHACASCQ